MTTNEQLANAAARYWSELWRTTNPSVHEDTLAKFRQLLIQAVLPELDGVGRCALVCDYDPFEPLLSAIQGAGVECRGMMFSAKGIFPQKHRMYIEDGGIRVVEGYGAPDRLLDLSSET